MPLLCPALGDGQYGTDVEPYSTEKNGCKLSTSSMLQLRWEVGFLIYTRPSRKLQTAERPARGGCAAKRWRSVGRGGRCDATRRRRRRRVCLWFLPAVRGEEWRVMGLDWCWVSPSSSSFEHGGARGWQLARRREAVWRGSRGAASAAGDRRAVGGAGSEEDRGGRTTVPPSVTFFWDGRTLAGPNGKS